MTAPTSLDALSISPGDAGNEPWAHFPKIASRLYSPLSHSAVNAISLLSAINSCVESAGLIVSPTLV